MNWVFGKNKVIKNSNLTLKINTYSFQINNENLVEKYSNNLTIIIDGYIIPRYSFYEELKHYSEKELIAFLYQKHGLGFVKFIKGSFVIVIIDKEKVYFINDFHSFKKFFFYQKKNELLIADELSQISNLINLKPDNENIAMFCLMEHFVGGFSLFQDVSFSKPATILEINTVTSKTKTWQYFNIEDLISIEKTEETISNFSSFWAKMINNYINYFQPKDIGMTITGGNDSRMILSALLNKGIKANLFSFGNSKSLDVIVAKKIAKKTKYNYNNYQVSDPNIKWFSNYAKKILLKGNSLINIHRAHRFESIEKELIKNPNTEMLFGGFMGGDYVKGLIYDHYITPRFLWEYEFGANKHNLDALIPDLLSKAGINKNHIDIRILKKRINSLPFIESSDYKKRKLNTLFHLIGSMHDWQDTSIFGTKIQYMVNPFMDIDFLEKLYSSTYSFLSIKRSFLYNKLRLGRSDFHIGITNNLAKSLSDIEYAKKGYYNANEYLKNNPVLLTTKRVLRIKKHQQYPANFPYNHWIKDYIHNEFSKAQVNDLNNLFNWSYLFDSLQKQKNNSHKEGDLHLFTNPINIALNIQHYSNKK